MSSPLPSPTPRDAARKRRGASFKPGHAVMDAPVTASRIAPSGAPIDSTSSSIDAAMACAAELADALPLVLSAWRAGMRRTISDGLSVPQFRCLARISRQPGISVSELTAFLGVTMATTSAMVDRLAAAGYVSVAVAPADRRRSVITVSPAGADLVERMRAGGRSELAKALDQFSAADLRTVHRAAALLHRSFHRG